METELKKSRDEVSLFAQQLHHYETSQRDTEAQLQQARERVTRLNNTVEKARIEVEKTRQKEQDLDKLSEALANHKNLVAELENERAELQAKVDQLEQDATEIERLNEALEVSNRRSRKLARALKSARAKSQHAAPIPAPLSSAEVSAELEDLSCGVIVSDIHQKIARVNAVASEMLSRTSRQIVGDDLATITEDERWQKTLDQFYTGQDVTVSTTLKVGDTHSAGYG